MSERPQYSEVSQAAAEAGAEADDGGVSADRPSDAVTVVAAPSSKAGRSGGRADRVTQLGWQDRARCSGQGLDLFFPDGGDTRRAKAFCSGCPVWGECLRYGLEEDHGVWGGLNRAERARLRRLQQRLSAAPADPANSADIRRLLSVGLAPERLSEVAGLEVESIIARADIGRRRRNGNRLRQPVSASA